MFNLLDSLARDAVNREAERILKEKITSMIKLDPNAQYILTVDDEDTAQRLVESLRTALDLSKGPRLVILAAHNIKMIEINRS